jgi:hypothetical protein
MRKQNGKSWFALAGAVMMAGCLGGQTPTGGGSTTGGGTDPGSSSGGGSGGQTGGGSTGAGTGTGSGSGSGGATGGTGTGSGQTATSPLDARQIDYGQALRTAALKLVGTLPTTDELVAAKDAASYSAQIDKYLADPRLPKQLLSYFQDLMKMGGTINTPVGNQNVMVNLDTAPTFAAQLVVQDRSIMELFTATTNTCPTLNKATGAFTAGSCAVANGLTTAGVLTDPGAMSTMFSNMAFRRVRWVQESFVCTKFPAEFSATPVAKGSGQYVSPWAFESITGGTDKTVAPVNFQDVSSVVCANCHSTMNHIAPLFANFNAAGVFQTAIQVQTPVPGNPATKLTDWLPAGQPLSWRYQKPVTNLTELGAAMAADPDVADCQVARAWNWAMSKTDIVNDLSTVPKTTTATVSQLFATSGYKLKPVLKAIFTHDDFVKF